MNQLIIRFEISGFDRVVYDRVALWDNFSMSKIEEGVATIDARVDHVQNEKEVKQAIGFLEKKCRDLH